MNINLTDIAHHSILEITTYMIDLIDDRSIVGCENISPIGGRKSFVECLSYEVFLNKFMLWYDLKMPFGLTSSFVSCPPVFPFVVENRKNYNEVMPLFHVECRLGRS